jgi:hypothetical protein
MPKRIGANKLRHRTEARSPQAMRAAARRSASAAKVFIIAAAVCLGAVVGAQRMWHWLGASPRFTVHSIEVRGAVRIDPKEIRRLSRLKEGIRMLDVKPAIIKKNIMGNCWVRRAIVARRFPATVVITVEERTPIALVNVGGIYYVDAEGALMPLFAATYSDLPLVSGLGRERVDSAGKRIGRQAMERVNSFFDQAGAVSETLLKHVSQIDFSNESMVRVTMENSPMLIEIDDRKGKVQWTRFQDLMDVLDNTPEGMPQRINLCYSNLGFAQW